MTTPRTIPVPQRMPQQELKALWGQIPSVLMELSHPGSRADQEYPKLYAALGALAFSSPRFGVNAADRMAQDVSAPNRVSHFLSAAVRVAEEIPFSKQYTYWSNLREPAGAKGRASNKIVSAADKQLAILVS